MLNISNSNFKSEGIVYIIFCNLCHDYYVGQSYRSAYIRIKEHLYNIKKFKENLSYSLSNLNKQFEETAIHFNLKNHSLKNFNYFIFDNNIRDDLIRRSIENDLIHLFLSLNVKIINKMIPDVKYIKHLAFS